MNINNVSFNNFTFVDVHEPKETEIKYLRHTYNFSQIHLDDYLSGQQVPKIELSKDYVLIVLDFPFVELTEENNKVITNNHNGQKPDNNSSTEITTISEIITNPMAIPRFLFGQSKEKRLKTGHINFFIGKDLLVILHDEKTPQVDKIFNDCRSGLRSREKYLSNGSFYLFYLIVDQLVDSTYNIMGEITSSVDNIDLHLLQNYSPIRIVEEISATRRNLVFFKSMLSPALGIFAELHSDKYKEFGSFEEASWSSISDHLRKIISRLEGSNQLLDGIARSHESLLTAKTNEIVKVLTMFTAIMLPLTLLTGIYGMNIGELPGAQTQGILLFLSLIMTGIAASMIIVFRIRRWF